ncbi:hypothetical protein RRG08_000406 [Elysia crispata]|uniref:Uncharacterized protein n=1 Tax=Elysia crispata TaxID=231223 RepID=A0AAE1AY64_9GAST|nr:hypothetical protein RRG08_000406 [Elysia crispata]
MASEEDPYHQPGIEPYQTRGLTEKPLKLLVTPKNTIYGLRERPVPPARDRTISDERGRPVPPARDRTVSEQEGLTERPLKFLVTPKIPYMASGGEDRTTGKEGIEPYQTRGLTERPLKFLVTPKKYHMAAQQRKTRYHQPGIEPYQTRGLTEKPLKFLVTPKNTIYGLRGRPVPPARDRTISDERSN